MTGQSSVTADGVLSAVDVAPDVGLCVFRLEEAGENKVYGSRGITLLAGFTISSNQGGIAMNA